MSAQCSRPPSFPPIRACLFDMDGLLINTEDLYSTVTNEILHAYGKPSLPWSLKARLQGRPGPQAFALFRAWAQLPLKDDDYHAQNAALQQRYFPTCKPLPGVLELLERLRTAGVHVALATSSGITNYHLKTDHLPELVKYFPERMRVLGDDPRVVGKGKPAPDIFLAAMEEVNVECRERGEREVRPEECLVFEDAIPGVEAGRRAGMRVVWCPHQGLLEVTRDRVDEILAGRGEEKESEESAPDERPENLEQHTEGILKGWPGRVGDGWGEIVASLEGFDVNRYGIGTRQ